METVSVLVIEITPYREKASKAALPKPVHTYPSFKFVTFSFRIQKFARSTCRVCKSNSPVHTHLMVSRFTLEASRETSPTPSASILVYCSVRDWTQFCYIIGFKNIWIRLPHVIRFVDSYTLRIFFSALESGLNIITIRRQIRWMCVHGIHIRNPYPESISISGPRFSWASMFVSRIRMFVSRFKELPRVRRTLGSSLKNSSASFVLSKRPVCIRNR